MRLDDNYEKQLPFKTHRVLMITSIASQFVALASASLIYAQKYLQSSMIDRYNTMLELISIFSACMASISLTFDTSLLDAQFTNKEIKYAVWSCGGEKAPGPDGFTFKFIKRFWDTMGNDFIEMVKRFEVDGTIPKECSFAFGDYHEYEDEKNEFDDVVDDNPLPNYQKWQKYMSSFKPDIPETPLYNSKPMISKHYKKETDVKVGQISENKEALDLAIKLKALDEGYQFLNDTSAPERYALKCFHFNECAWKIRATRCVGNSLLRDDIT
ncbi:transposase, MuDR, MULE transposase domain protein [Tanacetum coccineum]